MRPTTYALILIALPTAAAARPVRNSFINRPVSSTADLIVHVRSDATVTDRYVRHFSMDRVALLRYLGGLHRGKLTKDGIYTIYSVPRGGWLKMHVGRLRKGEPMFLDSTGRPVLVAKCGNPVVIGRSPSRQGNPLTLVPSGLASERALDGETAAEGSLGSPVAMEPTAPAPVAFVQADEGVRAMEAVVPTVGVSGSESFSMLGFLGVLAPILGSSLASTDSKDLAPVPEPMSLLALAAGSAFVMRRRRSILR